MATARITCPDCKAVIKPAKPVPDGKKVKCPKCGNVFTTPGLVQEEEQRSGTKVPAKKAPKKKEKPALKKAIVKPAAKKTDFDDDEESGGIYSFVESGEKKKDEDEEESRPQIEYAPDMSIKDLRGPAQELVVKPSNLMMLICGLSALSNLFLICWSFWPMVFSDSVVDWQKFLIDYYKAKQDKNAIGRVESYKDFKDVKDKDLELVEDANVEAAKWRYLMMGGFILLLIYNAIATIGAVKMQNLESRGWGIASAIMMLLPPGAGGLSSLFAVGVAFLEQITGFLGDVTVFYMIVASVLPYLVSIFISVMAMQVLFSQKVIEGFEYVAD